MSSLSKSQFDTILAQLVHLSPEQAVQVRERLAFLHGKVDKIDDSKPWLLEGAYWELRKRGLLTGKGPPFRLVKTWSITLLRDLRDVEAFLTKAVGRDLNAAEKAILSQVCFSTLCDWLVERRLTPGLRMLLSNIHNIPAALDASFPGYVSAGLLGMVLSKGKIGVRKNVGLPVREDSSGRT